MHGLWKSYLFRVIKHTQTGGRGGLGFRVRVSGLGVGHPGSR